MRSFQKLCIATTVLYMNRQDTRHSRPCLAMFGRVPKLPVDFNAACSHDPEEKLQEYLTAADPLEGEREAKRWKTEDAIKANIQTAQQKQKHYYDKRHGTSTCFTVGDTVLKKDFWLQPLWERVYSSWRNLLEKRYTQYHIKKCYINTTKIAFLLPSFPYNLPCRW